MAQNRFNSASSASLLLGSSFLRSWGEAKRSKISMQYPWSLGADDLEIYVLDQCTKDGHMSSHPFVTIRSGRKAALSCRSRSARSRSFSSFPRDPQTEEDWLEYLLYFNTFLVSILCGALSAAAWSYCGKALLRFRSCRSWGKKRWAPWNCRLWAKGFRSYERGIMFATKDCDVSSLSWTRSSTEFGPCSLRNVQSSSSCRRRSAWYTFLCCYLACSVNHFRR